MTEIEFEYLNKLASQLITITSLLGGFSIAIVANLLVSKMNTRLGKSIFIVTILSACSFLISLFAFVSVVMMTTDGYSNKIITANDLLATRLIGFICFLFGVIFLTTFISLAGYTKSKKIGIFTTAIGILTIVLLLTMIT